jgi:TRAP-type mannitol/chloroaromatic compound transport system permease small subunit
MTSHSRHDGGSAVDVLLRAVALSVVAVGLIYTINNYFNFWRGWPGVDGFFAHYGWFGLDPLPAALNGTAVLLGWIQLGFYLVPVAVIIAIVSRTPHRPLGDDAESLIALAAYIARAAYWAVLLIGLVDMAISFLRVEGILAPVVGSGLAEDLGRSRFRGEYVHYPLMGIALVIAYFTRSLGFIWLALLIVLAEFQIVISRFVFSYEQAFMGDLVRFWYGALFLFASAYTLIEEGHVRVDILYTGFTERGKAWTNCIGAAVLGVPLCWVVLTRGIGGKSNLINAPLLSYEVTQSGFGMYVKYLMAGFLLIYALTMLVVFASTFLSSAAVLLHGRPSPAPDAEEQPV